ncbi:MAG TPA: DUF1598 domain-containing protein [Tepidisphaeraceae bacterium]|jgi:hypothetical protein|nr:DUF1598 domain-containing protein [Tepidisphaeraceae bacterium]
MSTDRHCNASRASLQNVVLMFVAGALMALAVPIAKAQYVPGTVFGNSPGVYLRLDGTVNVRQADEKGELAAMRARVRATADATAKGEKLVYISLPKLFAEVRSLKTAGKEIPEELRFLHGMTQLRYVFVFPEDKDIVIAGPAEPWQTVHAEDDSTQYVVGKRTGHPVMQLDDMIVAFRTALEGRGNVFGCGIYPSPDSIKIADGIAHRMIRNTRAERMAALQEGLGPQEIRIFGTRNDTRFAYICVAADYELKRFALNLDHAPVAHLPSAIDNTRSAANKFWFAADYEPLLVSKDGNSFQIRGQRLEVQCGAFDFDPRGATRSAQNFAVQFTRQLPLLATAVPLYAELQNIADEALLGNLLRHDRVAEKIGWDNAWIFDDAACPVAKIPTPKLAQTLVSYSNGSIAAGGVTLVMGPYVSESARQPDENGTFDGPTKELAVLRAGHDKNATSDSPTTKGIFMLPAK